MGERAQESHQGPGADPSSGQCPFLLPAQALPGLAVSLPSTSAAAPRETSKETPAISKQHSSRTNYSFTQL